MDTGQKDLVAHVQAISIRLGHQLRAPGGRSSTGTAGVCAELWAWREVEVRSAGQLLIHDARGQHPVPPRELVASARAVFFGGARAVAS